MTLDDLLSFVGEADDSFLRETGDSTPSDAGSDFSGELPPSPDDNHRPGSDFSGERDSGRTGLESVVEAFEELLLLPDRGAVFVALAAVVANYADGDPVWPLLVAPPSTGKSEVISALNSSPKVVGSLFADPADAALGVRDEKGPPASFLHRIGEFGILAFKDLTTVLTMPNEARAAIIGQLREVADGHTEKSFGNGVHAAWDGKLGLIAAVTPIIDKHHGFISVMGERFVMYRMPEVNRRDLARRALTKRGNENELRLNLKAAVSTFLEQFVNCGIVPLPDPYTEPLIELADLVTRARSGVARDGYSRDLIYLPEAEAPTRLAKQLAQLTGAMLAIGVEPGEAWRIITKVAWDCVPAARTAVLDAIVRSERPIPITHVSEHTGLPRKTVERVIDDLAVLRTIARTKSGSEWVVAPSPVLAEYWDGEGSPEKSEGGW